MGSDGLFMVGSHIAHDCIVGDRIVMANNATLGGHVVMGDNVFMGGLAAAHQYSRIGRHAFIGGLAAVTKDVIPFGSVWGNHAHLEGLNLVGLKRRGFTREAINDLRAAYRLLFAEGRHLSGAGGRRGAGVRRLAGRHGDRRLHPRRRQPPALPADPGGLTPWLRWG